MNAAWSVLVGLFLSQSPEKPLDPDATLDVSKVDRTPQTEAERLEENRAHFDALTGPAAKPGSEIELESGAAVQLELEITLTRPAAGPLALRIPRAREGRLELGPILSKMTLGTKTEAPAAPAPKRKKRKKKPPRGEVVSVIATGRYFVRAEGDKPGSVRQATSVDVIELSTGAVVGQSRLEPKVRIIAPTATAPEVEALEKAAGYFERKRAEVELGLQTTTGAKVVLTPEQLQPGRINVGAFDLITQALEHAWRAEVALARLRALTRASDSSVAAAALLAVGRLVPRADLSRAQSRGAPADELVRVKQDLEALQLERAELLIAGLRRRGDLTRTELGDLLAFDAAVSAIRGQKDAAERLMGRALCLEPAREPPDTRAPIVAVLESVKAAGLCDKPLRAEPPEAFITTTNGKTELQVRIAVGPDPYGVVAGGTVMLFGGGGGVIAERKVRAEGEGQRVLVASFPDDDELRNIEGALLVQVMAKDVSGVVLASIGDPVPVRLEVGEHEDYSESWPWWVWVGGAAIVVAGAGIATIALVPRDEVRGIGPFDVRF